MIQGPFNHSGLSAPLREPFLREHSPRGARRHRGAALYMTVFGTATIVAIVTLATLLRNQTDTRSTGILNDVQSASILAQAALEHGLLTLEQLTVDDVPTWRSAFTSGQTAYTRAFSEGTISWMLVDEDGDLADDRGDRLTLYGTGAVGDALRVCSVLLEPADKDPLSCLEVSWFADTGLSFNASTINSDQTIGTNGSVTEVGLSAIGGNIEAVAGITGDNFSGSQSPGAASREMPDSETAFDHYIASGTVIPPTAVPKNMGTFQMANRLLSPTNNPFGAPNPLGVYVFYCGNSPLVIQKCRIVGTLVLLDPGSGSSIQQANNLAPAVSNYPSVLVRGSLSLNSSGTLVEGGAVPNLNPPGTPYDGSEDSDTSDSYPSAINGLIYVSDTLSIAAGSCDGAIVCGTASALAANFSLNYDSTFKDNPPPGFTRAEGRVAIVPGTWRWSELP